MRLFIANNINKGGIKKKYKGHEPIEFCGGAKWCVE
jgi:hypothetical protein